jgi:hypothetical protein
MNDYSASSTPARRSLAYLWIARDLSSLGGWIAIVALLAWTYRSAEAARTVALLLVAWMTLPVLLRPIAAAVVDSSNGWAVGSIALLLRAAALFPLLTVRLSDDLQTVLIVALVASAPTAFIRASHIALLPATMGPERLQEVMRPLLTTRFLAMVVGATAAVYLFRMDELRSIAFVVAAAFILSAVMTAMVRPGRAVEPAMPRRSALMSLASALLELFRALRHPVLQPIIVVHLLFALLIGGAVVAVTAFVTWGLFMPQENLGFLLASQGAALVVALGSRRFTRTRYPTGATVAGGILMAALAMFGFILTNDVPLAAVFTFFIGLGAGLAILGLGSMLRVARGGAGGKVERDLSIGLAAATGVAVLISVAVVGAVVDTIMARFTLALLSGALMILGVYAFGALPVLSEGEKDPPPDQEGPLSTMLPD